MRYIYKYIYIGSRLVLFFCRYIIFCLFFFLSVCIYHCLFGSSSYDRELSYTLALGLFLKRFCWSFFFPLVETLCICVTFSICLCQFEKKKYLCRVRQIYIYIYISVCGWLHCRNKTEPLRMLVSVIILTNGKK